jgi:hypothetical protein
MNHAKTSFGTEIVAGAVISVVQYVAPLSIRVWGVYDGTKESVPSFFDAAVQ